MKRLEELKNETWLCNHCAMCTETICDEAGYYRTCPVYRQLRFEDNSAKGHNTIALYLLQGSLKYTQELSDCLYKCTTCATCEEICVPVGSISALMGGNELKTFLPEVVKPLGINLEPILSVKILKAMRADCVDLGIEPEPVKKMAESIRENNNPFNQPHVDRMKWAQGLDIPQEADTVLFVGCRPAYIRQEIAISTAKILKNAGIMFTVLPDEKCCGASLLGAGHVDLAEKVIKHNVDLLKKMKVKKVISICSDGCKSMQNDWPDIAGKLPFEVVHITELLCRLISEEKITFKNQINKRVTYHDPCHLGRGMKIYREPRAILNAIPGLDLVEMYPNKHGSWCCGAGGEVKLTNPDLALDIGTKKISLVKEIGASVLATSCPQCKTNFLDIIGSQKTPVEVKDVIELVAESMGI